MTLQGGDAVLCVATPDPDSPAETFVRQHIRRVAPGRTVVLYFRGHAEALDGVPALKAPRPSDRPAIEAWLGKAVSTLVHGYPGVVSGRSADQVERFFRKNRVTAVLAEFGSMGNAVAPICCRLGIRLVVNFHGHDATTQAQRPIIRRAYRALNRSGAAFVCGSMYFSKVLAGLGFDGDRIFVVPCGIETEAFIPDRAKDPDLVIAVGRFVEKKRPDLSIRAFAQALQERPTARLEMIGDGLLLPACRELVREMGLADRVIFHGSRPHDFVIDRLSRAALFIQHSVVAPNGDTESQGISLLEAMASEVPVVATRHNGFTETVVEGETGFLVEERDTGAMAVRMGSILNDPTLRAAMGQAGRERVLRLYAAELQAAKLRAILFPVDRGEAGSRS